MKSLTFVGIALIVLGCSSSKSSWQPGHSRVPIPAGARERRACASDLVCPIGFVCAKRAGEFTGDCAAAVDENGSPVDVPHSVESYSAGRRECVVNADCPPRFGCDQGRCIQ